MIIKTISKTRLLFMLVFLASLSFRTFHLNWDDYNHLHPDERMISLVTEKISWPRFPPHSNFFQKITILFSAESPLNPRFFAYGSFPIYLLRAIGALFPVIGSYQNLNLAGRLISALADSFVIIILYRLTQVIFQKHQISLLASTSYAFFVLPIQLSHFYTVDTLLNLFIIFTLYRLVCFFHHRTFLNAVLVSLGFSLSLATKVSATVLLFSLGFSLIVNILLSLKKIYYLRGRHHLIRLLITSTSRRRHLAQIVIYIAVVLFFSSLFYFILQPFTFFDFSTFWTQINEQRAMTKNPFVFPYTLQYVGTPAYFYQFSNIFLWGLGPGLSILAVFGACITFYHLIKGLTAPGNEKSEGGQLIVFTFFLAYVITVGQFAVKFMRYLLPVYPIFAIFVGVSLSWFISRRKFIVFLPFLLAHLIWLMAFMSIYRQPNTRLQATNWILANIPPQSLILREHWDDGLPLGYHPYSYFDLPLYDPESFTKWQTINSYLNRGDYLIIASNRLYTPLSRLTDCSSLPPSRCYPQTARYYQDLFAGNLGYQKVAEFSSYPSFLGFEINDQSADESFTVYDHPKVMIFKNTAKW